MSEPLALPKLDSSKLFLCQVRQGIAIDSRVYVLFPTHTHTLCFKVLVSCTQYCTCFLPSAWEGGGKGVYTFALNHLYYINILTLALNLQNNTVCFKALKLDPGKESPAFAAKHKLVQIIPILQGIYKCFPIGHQANPMQLGSAFCGGKLHFLGWC